MTYTQKYEVPNCLKDHLIVDTRSIEYARDVAANSFVRHELKKIHGVNDFHFVHSHAFLNDISLCYTSYGNELIVEPEPMGEFYLVQIPMHGFVNIKSNDRRSTLQGKTCSVISPMNHNRFHWSKDSGVLSIKIQRQALVQQLQNLTQSDICGDLEFELVMHMGEPAYRSWSIEIIRLMQYFQSDEASELMSLEGWFEQKLMEILLVGHPHNYSKLLTRDNYEAPQKCVGIAIDYMHENFMEKITLATLASVSGVTSRTLHNGFKRYRDLSPMEYLLETRLKNAMKHLSTANENSNVTDIAQAAGFTHLGRFSQQFYQKFGELPSEVLKRSIG